MTLRPTLAAVAASAVAVAGCSTEPGALDYYTTVQTQLNAVTKSYEAAERACWLNYQDPNCQPAVRDYRQTIIHARRTVKPLNPPKGAREAHRTVIRATRVAQEGADLALSGIRAGNPDRWWAGVQRNKEAAGYVSLAWSQLR